ncbi:MAG: hypothetical protein ABIP94_23145 [Planctomycetota bacterium]
MKNVFAACFAVLTLTFAGCAQPKHAAALTRHAPLLNNVCIVTGEPLDADSPTVDYKGGKIGFCCDKCLGKWNSMDDGQKKAAFDARK